MIVPHHFNKLCTSRVYVMFIDKKIWKVESHINTQPNYYPVVWSSLQHGILLQPIEKILQAIEKQNRRFEGKQSAAD